MTVSDVSEGALSLDRPAPPAPTVDVDSEGFWAAAREGYLALCRCQACGAWLQPPLERCRHCAGPTAFERAAGTGTVHSYIVVHHPSVQAFADELPYVIALVELDEGVRLPGRVVDAAGPEVEIGARVHAEVVDVPGATERAVVFRLD